MALSVELTVGNTAERVADDRWAWSVFVTAGRHARLIDHVVFRLHETFTNPEVVVKDSDLTGSYRLPVHTGWGVFEVAIEVHWKSPAILAPAFSSLAHMLDFNGSEAPVPLKLTARPPAPRPPAPRPSRPAREPSVEPVAPEAELRKPTVSREEALEKLKATAFLEREDPRFFHGRLCRDELPLPAAAWTSSKKPREGSAEWLTATEFQDAPEVLEAKVELLATLLMLSRKTVAYTGAGISVAAGIGQAAVGTAVGTKTINAEPTLTHHTMAALGARGWLSGWVQQNHDGLPQKAGYPQESINEIHGSWFDPSNPVVLYSGTLRSELCEEMVELAETSDLTLVMGTSLTGLNADQVAKKPARRSLHGLSLGTVIISPQQTEQDGKATLRIFAKSDDVMALLAKKLGLAVRSRPRSFAGPLRVAVPYDREGRKSDTERTIWNLEVGQKVRVSEHNNIQGAGQPSHRHISAATVGEIVRVDERCCSLVVEFGSAQMRLGLWWLEVAQRGAVDWLPVVNVHPECC